MSKYVTAILLSSLISFVYDLAPLYCQVPSQPLVWLKADAGIVEQNGRITEWIDQTPFNHLFIQPEVDRRPYHHTDDFSGKPAVHFDGLSYLEGPKIFPAAKDYTINVVLRVNDTTMVNNILSGDKHGFWFDYNAYPAVVHDDQFQYRATSFVPVRAGVNIITVRYSQETEQATLYVNGLFGDSTYTGVNHDSTFYLGAYLRQYFFHGDIGEILLYDRELSNEERLKLEEYEFNKYSISRPDPLPLPDSTFSTLPSQLQLFPREADDSARVQIEGRVWHKGFESIHAELYKNGVLVRQDSLSVNSHIFGSPFGFAFPIHAELSEYKIVVRLHSQDKDSILAVRDSIVCGDVYLIEGQSNATFGYWGPVTYNEYCRTFGINYSHNIRDSLWAISLATGWGDGPSVGAWGLELQKRIAEEYKIPVAIINGAVSGTIIEHHLRNEDYPQDLRTIYGRMLYRTRKSNLAKSAKALLFCHGELNFVADYSKNFKTLYQAWLEDYPSLEKIYVMQLRPSYCCNLYNEELRDLQRSLPDSLPYVETFSTTGIPYQDGCHFFDSGFVAYGDQLFRLLARDFYHASDSIDVGSPTIVKAYYTNKKRNELRLVFSPSSANLVVGKDTTVLGASASLKDYLYLNDESGHVKNISADHNALLLTLDGPSSAATVSYAPDRYYTNTEIIYEGPWILNSKGVGATIFYRYPITEYSSRESKETGSWMVEVFPNPAKESITVHFLNGQPRIVHVEVSDIMGRRIMKKKLHPDPDADSLRLDLNNIPSGIYTIIITSEQGKTSQIPFIHY